MIKVNRHRHTRDECMAVVWDVLHEELPAEPLFSSEGHDVFLAAPAAHQDARRPYVWIEPSDGDESGLSGVEDAADPRVDPYIHMLSFEDGTRSDQVTYDKGSNTMEIVKLNILYRRLSDNWKQLVDRQRTPLIK